MANSIKEFRFDQEARQKILNGINILAKAVGTTLGPSGRTVLIQQDYGPPRSTKDGVSVAKSVFLEDQFEDMGAQVAKQAASKTADVAGDGTTTATVLAQAIVNRGSELVTKGYNPANLKRGIDLAVDKIVEEIAKVSKPVVSKKEIMQIGTISANEDNEIGQLIADAMEKVGNEGIISLEEGKSVKTELKVVNGYEFDRGYLSPHFVTNENLECVLENPLILLCEGSVNNVNVILPILKQCHEKIGGRPLLIIADDIAGDALPTLVVNHLKRAFMSCAVKSPGFGDRRGEMMRDISVLTGATLVCEDLGIKLENFDTEWLGSAKHVIITKNSCTIIEGDGGPSDIETRVSEIRNSIKTADGDWEKEKSEERLAKLVGGVAVISVGGTTESEMKEKKDRVEDALNATRAAVVEGIVAGAGVPLLRISNKLNDLAIPNQYVNFESVKPKNWFMELVEKIFGGETNKIRDEIQAGIKIVQEAIEEPFKKIILNSGKNPNSIKKIILKNDRNTFGYNSRTEKFEDLVESGVIDPAKVVRCALQNAASIAGLVLTTECMIANKEIKEKTK